MPRWAVAAGLAVVVLASRLAHLKLLWVEEAYGLAAARELLRGRALYTDVWFDKPPLYAWFYTLCGGAAGLPLRLLDTAFVLFCGWCAWLTARRIWAEQEGLLAAVLMCWGLTFYFPASVMAVTPDNLAIPAFCLAIWAAQSGRYGVSAVFSGVAVLCNSKALIVPVIAAVWGGHILPLVGVLGAVAGGSAYFQQVWMWGARYSADTFVAQPVREGLLRTAGWIGFHLSGVVGTVVYMVTSRHWQAAVWLVLSTATVVGGLRFFPRYYFLLLPAVCVLGARGLFLVPRRWTWAILVLLLIPFVRFGPRYASLAVTGPAGWADAALMQDSRRAADIVRSAARPGDTILVWGYRPDIAVWSGLSQGTRWLDCQPLTGVIADRHLTQSVATFPELAAENRKALVQGPRPTFLVDGLGPVNPSLGVGRFEDLARWLAGYERIGASDASVIYRLKNP